MPSGCTVGSGRLSIRIGAALCAAQALDHRLRLGDIGAIGRAVVAGRHGPGDGVARPEGADQDDVVRALGGEPHIVREGGGDLEIHAPRGRLPAQEVGLHLQVAVAEQQGGDRAARVRMRSSTLSGALAAQ